MNGRTGQYNVWPKRSPEEQIAIGRVQDTIIRRHGAWLRKHSLVFDCTLWDMCGCTTVEFVDHFEKQFTEGMKWFNYGEWSVDHIYPLAAVKHWKIEDVLGAFHYTNLRPLWRRKNMMKGSRIISDTKPRSSLQRRTQDGFPESIAAETLKIKKAPNKALETTPVAVTSCAFAHLAPSTSVSHL